MNENRRLCDIMVAIASLLLVAAMMCGCAGDIARLKEVAPDGTKFKSSRATVSTVGSKQDRESAGISYSGKSADGSEFDLSTGGDTIGQEAGDGVAVVQVLVQALSAALQAQAAGIQAAPAEEPPAPSLEAIVERLRRIESQTIGIQE